MGNSGSESQETMLGLGQSADPRAHPGTTAEPPRRPNTPREQVPGSAGRVPDDRADALATTLVLGSGSLGPLREPNRPEEESRSERWATQGAWREPGEVAPSTPGLR